MDLFTYQAETVQRLRLAFRSHRRIVLQMPTGSGKTTVAAELMRSAVAKGHKVIFAAHLDSLISDTQDRLLREGIVAGRIQAGHDPTDSQVQVCSLQTLHARKIIPDAKFVILDECHRALAPTVRDLIGAYPEAWILGLTATPVRGDGQGLGDVFDHMVVGPSIRHLVSIGRLVPCEVIAPETYSKELARSPSEIVQSCDGKSIVVFTATVGESKAIAKEVGGIHVDGEMDLDERAEKLKAFSRGETRVISNCMVLTEGWDAPRADTCVIARGASHVGSYLQMIGRVMRAHEGKNKATIYDLRGSVHLHGLPDEDRVYSLDGIEKISAEKKRALKTCKNCLAVFRPRVACPRCGFINPLPPATVKERRLEEIKASKAYGLRSEFDRLVAIQKARQYKPGWVGVKFKEKAGFWPPWRIPA